MIPRAHIIAWRNQAPWPRDEQVEQDLILSRALVEIFAHPLLSKKLAFRGGTALQKLYMRPAARYSEDIDLVQLEAGPIGPVMQAIHEQLNPWLDQPKTKQNQGRVTFIYRFETEIPPIIQARLKIEINTREHFHVFDLQQMPFEVDNPWFSGGASIYTYQLEELLGTKMRALYQRKKGRDFFDLALFLSKFPQLNKRQIVDCFQRYMEFVGQQVSRAQFEKNLSEKFADEAFTNDIQELLLPGTEFDPKAERELVMKGLVKLLPGDPWKGKAE